MKMMIRCVLGAAFLAASSVPTWAQTIAGNPLATSRCYVTMVHEFPTGEGISPVSDLIMTSDTAGFRFQASGMRCEQGAYFVTIIPERSLPDAPVVCGSNFRFREENGQAYPAWLIANGLDHLGDEVCGPVYLPVSRQFRYSMDSGQAMRYYGSEEVELSYQADNGNQASVRMPNARQSSWFGQVWNFFHGASSGLFWAGPERSGEGLIVTVEQRTPWHVDPVMFMAMFTFDQLGDPMWLVGNYVMNRAGVLTFEHVPLLRTSGVGFGDNFDPNSIEREVVADIELHENGCVAKWFRIVGESGWEWLTFNQPSSNWRRLLGSFDFICQSSRVDQTWG